MMKIFRSRTQLAVVFVPGFLLGIIYMNIFAGKYLAEPGMFNEHFLKELQSVQIDVREYIWYLLRLRILPAIALYALSNTPAAKWAAALFVFWSGTSAGIFISSAVSEMGIKGSFFCMAGIFPQFIFYVPAYVVLILHCYNSPQSRWNRQKMLFVFFCISAGIILELYVNPFLVKAFLSSM